jgi:predicted Zn finger-like uncharacterized protein
MVVECPKCKAKYEVADIDVPSAGGAVRCLECSNLFTIYKEPLNIELTPLRESEFEPSVSEAKEILRRNIEPGKAESVETSFPDEVAAGPSAPETVPFETVTASPAAPEAVPFETAVESPAPEAEAPTAPVTDDPVKMKKHRKAERLGRSLVKDIYLYHKDKVEQGRRDGTLVQLLGEEIKRSWKFYKKQVDPEVLQERNYFKDALNDIIAEGKEVFK